MNPITGTVPNSFFRDKNLGWSGQDFGYQGKTTWGQIADKLGVSLADLSAANKSWWSGTTNPDQVVDLSWLTQNMAGRLTAPGATPTVTTQAQSDQFLQNSNATMEAANAAKNTAGQLTPGSQNNVGPWIKDNNYNSPTYGQMIANPAYGGPAVSPYDPNAPITPPKLNIPTTIPSSVLSSTATKAGVLSGFPTTNLQPGQTSPEVKKLQEFLISKGLLAEGLNTGYFGDLTKAAVAKLQTTLGVNAGADAGYYGPKTQSALADPAAFAKLQGDVQNSIASGTPEGKAKADAALTSAGIPPPQLPTNYDPAGLTAMYNQYLSYQSNRQQQLDKVTQQMSEAILAATGASNTASGRLGTTLTAIGGEQQRIKANLQSVLDTYKPLADTLTNELKLNSKQMSTALTFAKTLADLNKPEYHTVNGQLWQFSPDGTIKKYGEADSSSGLTKAQQAQQAEVKDISSQLLASRNQGAEADGVYADPNLYARLRNTSTMSASEFDNRFGYLVNPLSARKLGITNANAGLTSDLQAVLKDAEAAMKEADSKGTLGGKTSAEIRAAVLAKYPQLKGQL